MLSSLKIRSRWHLRDLEGVLQFQHFAIIMRCLTLWRPRLGVYVFFPLESVVGRVPFMLRGRAARKVSMQRALQTGALNFQICSSDDCFTANYLDPSLSYCWIRARLIKIWRFSNCKFLDQFMPHACKTPRFCTPYACKWCRPWPWEFEFFAGFASCWRTYGKSAIEHVIFRTALNWLSLPTNHLYWSLLTLSSGPALLLCLTRHISSFYFLTRATDLDHRFKTEALASFN